MLTRVVITALGYTVPSDIWFECFSSVEGFGLEAEARMTTWHVMIPSDIEPDGGYSQDVSEGSLPSAGGSVAHFPSSDVTTVVSKAANTANLSAPAYAQSAKPNDQPVRVPA